MRDVVRDKRALAAIAAATIVLGAGAAPAGAAITSYAGSFGDIGGSSIRLTVETKRVKGKRVQTLKRVEAELPGYCDDGATPTLTPEFSTNTRLTRGGDFSATAYGGFAKSGSSVTTIRGGIAGPSANGQLAFTGDSPIFGSCATGLKSFFANRTRG